MVTIEDIKARLGSLLVYAEESEAIIEDMEMHGIALETISYLRFAISQHEEIEKLKRERDEWKQKYLDTREGRLNALRESEAPTNETGNARMGGE